MFFFANANATLMIIAATAGKTPAKKRVNEGILPYFIYKNDNANINKNEGNTIPAMLTNAPRIPLSL